jgi:hypothetical protein
MLAIPKDLSMLSERTRSNRLAAATVSFVGYTPVHAHAGTAHAPDSGPGIIRFELAGSVSQAEDIMTRWGSDGRRAARLSLWLDFGYMATYGMFMALLIDRARRRRGHPASLPSIMIVAIAADAAEGVALRKVLHRKRIAVQARRSEIAALIKFAVLSGALRYVATERFTLMRRHRPRR